MVPQFLQAPAVCLAGSILGLLATAYAAPAASSSSAATSSATGLPTTAAYFVSGTTTTFAHTTLTATGTDE
jgi:hypothetical protein